MLASPPMSPRPSIPRITGPDTQVLDDALAKSNQGRNRDDNRDDVLTAAAAVWAFGRRPVGGEEHAEGNEEVSDDFCVGGENVCEEDIAEFSIVGERDAADGDAAEGCKEAGAAG